MIEACHRCGAAVPEDADFCPQCGAPQIVVSEIDMEQFEQERAAVQTMGAPGVPPPPPPRIRWRLLVRIAAIIAAVAALFGGIAAGVPVFGTLEIFTVFFAPTLAISFYRRWAPEAPMDGGIGARMGVVLGLMLAFVTAAAMAGQVLVQRYVLHQGNEYDAEMLTALQRSFDRASAMNPDAPAPVWFLNFFQTPEGHAAMLLMSAAFLACATVAYCTLSAAFSGWVGKWRMAGKGA